MKNRRKWRVLLVVMGLSVILLLSACGGTPFASSEVLESKQMETGEFAPEQTQSIEIESEQTGTEATEPEESKAEEAGPVQEQPNAADLNIQVSSRGQFYEWNEDFSQPIFIGRQDIIYLREDNGALQTALEELNRQNEQEIEAVYEENIALAKEYEPRLFWEVVYSMDVERADSKVVSLLVQEYLYLGGVYDDTTHSSYNYDTVTGEILELRDVITDYDALYTYVVQELDAINQSEAYKDGYTEGYQAVVEELFYPRDAGAEQVVWNMNHQGLSILFNTYVLGPYARGVTVLEIPYTEHTEWFTEAYVPEGATKTIRQFPLEVDVYLDVNGDGREELVALKREESEELFRTTYTIYCNSTTLEESHSGYFEAAYLLEMDESIYLYIENISENDFQSLYVYDLTTGVPVYVDTIGAAFYGQYASDAENFILNSRIDALGTYSAYRHYYVGMDGMPIPHGEQYRIYNEWDRSLVSTIDLEVQVYDDAEHPENYRMVTLPAGTSLEPYATDEDSYMEFVLEDGTHCVLPFEREDYMILIQGISEYDCFEMLPYAG